MGEHRRRDSQTSAMVLLHVKKGEDINFLYRTPVVTSNDDATREVVQIWNMILRIRRLKYSCDELCQYGPMKPPEKQGLYDDEEAMMDTEAMAKANPHMDPTGKRTGENPSEELADVVRRTVADASAAIAKDQFERKVEFTLEMLQDHVDKIRGALMIAYPMGLPDWEPARQAVEDTEELEGTSEGQDVMQEDATVMWWASKQLDRSKTLQDFVGKNDKTKIVVQLTKKGAGAPQRQGQQQSKSEQEAMMAYYFKKKEEWRKLEEEDDDSYLQSEWANPKSMKNQLNGTSNVAWRPGR